MFRLNLAKQLFFTTPLYYLKQKFSMYTKVTTRKYKHYIYMYLYKTNVDDTPTIRRILIMVTRRKIYKNYFDFTSSLRLLRCTMKFTSKIHLKCM